MNAIRLITVQCFPSNGFLWVFLLYTLFKLSAPAFSSQLKVRLDFLSVIGVTILHSFTAWSACVCCCRRWTGWRESWWRWTFTSWTELFRWCGALWPIRWTGPRSVRSWRTLRRPETPWPAALKSWSCRAITSPCCWSESFTCSSSDAPQRVSVWPDPLLFQKPLRRSGGPRGRQKACGGSGSTEGEEGEEQRERTESGEGQTGSGGRGSESLGLRQRKEVSGDVMLWSDVMLVTRLLKYECLVRYYDSKRSAAKKEQKTVEAAQKVTLLLTKVQTRHVCSWRIIKQRHIAHTLQKL